MTSATPLVISGIERPRRWRLLAGLLTPTTLATMTACGADEPDETGTGNGVFVGQVSGTEASLALLSDGEAVAGYLCDGEEVSVWLRSAGPDADEVPLLDRGGTRRGTVTITTDSASGSIAIDGTEHPFTLAPAADQAGLYRAFADLGDDGTIEVGWILLSDGTQTGAVNTRTTTGTTINPAPPLDPTAGTITIDRIGDLAVQQLTTGFVNKTIF